KKSPDLGEYDPLTQADSDESEDDLVLNLQQNGGVKNGRSALGGAPEPGSDAEIAGRAKPRLSEVPTEGYPSEPPGGPEQKAASSAASYVRTSLFLLTVVVAVVLVLACAFLTPCPPRDLHSTWSRHLGPQAGGDLSPLELADVNGDGLRDVLLSFVTSRNASASGESHRGCRGSGPRPAAHPSASLLSCPLVPVGAPRPAAMLVCLSGMNGSTLWSSPLPEQARHITCLELRPGSGAGPVCLVTGTQKMLTAFNATSGRVVWTLSADHLSSGTLAAPGVVLPDVDGDGVRDLVVLAIGDSQPDLCFLLVSGRTGSPVGRPVKYSVVGVGNLIGPQVYVTASGAVYILFGFGKKQGSLRLSPLVCGLAGWAFCCPLAGHGPAPHRRFSPCRPAAFSGGDALARPLPLPGSELPRLGGRVRPDGASCVWPAAHPGEFCQTQLLSVGSPVVLGNIQAVALRDIFVQAQNRDSSPPPLQIEEPEWEKRRSANLSELIDIYSDGVELLQMVTAPDSNCSSLLVTTTQGLVLLRGQNLTPHWTLSLQGLRSQPTPGYFTDDQTLDFLLQVQDGVGMKKVNLGPQTHRNIKEIDAFVPPVPGALVVVDGDSGSAAWSHSVPCHMKETPTISAVTADQKSVFLFWAEGLAAESPSAVSERLSVSCACGRAVASPSLFLLLPQDGTLGTEPPGFYHLYLLHPAFPSILLDLANATGTVTASEVGVNDLWKDAFYVSRTTGPGSEGLPAPLVVSKLSLRWALMEGQVVQLKEATPKIGRGELRRFLARIKFVASPHQVRRC
ncbi:Protein FAM234B, partial [Galemys pyrenaicus]